MRKLLYLLLATVLAFLVSCSDDPSEIVVCPVIPEAIDNVQVRGTVAHDTIVKKKVLAAYSVKNSIYPDTFSMAYILPDSMKSVSEGLLMECVLRASAVHRENNKIYFTILEIDSVNIGASEKHAATCGTDEYLNTNALRTYPLSRAAMTRKAINVFVHVIRSTSGVGLNLDSATSWTMSSLSENYSSSEFKFVLIGSAYHDIMSDAWLATFRLNNEADFNKITSYSPHKKAIDIYIISNSNDTQTAGIAEKIESSSLLINYKYCNKETVAHEVGHCLGLFHTHHGTSAKESGIPELVNGSNAATAGDFIVDTPADPGLWNIFGYAGGNLTDANGQKYNPDPYNIMSYSPEKRFRLTRGQLDRIHSSIAGNSVLQQVVADYALDSPVHFKLKNVFEIPQLFADDAVTWKVTRHTSNNTEDSPETVSEITASGPSLTLESSVPEYFQISATISTGDGKIKTVFAEATSNEPSPYTGTLVWDAAGQSGGSTNMAWGQTLNVSGDVTLRLEYLDHARALLPGLDFRCVTAANRMLRGSSMRITKADCAMGYLKIRVEDRCGTSPTFFTIPTGISGGYYAVEFDSAGGVSFDGRSGVSAGGGHKSPAKAPIISNLKIYNADGVCIYSQESIGSIHVDIPAYILPAGSYTAHLNDGAGYEQEIPFCV